MNRREICYLDMDGVLVDFVGGACRVHNQPNPYSTNPEAWGEWNLEKLFGISVSQFWKGIDTIPDFWAELDPTPEAELIVQYAIEEFGVENLAILTSPSLSDECLLSKRQWLKRHFPQITGGITFAKDKGLYGHSLAFLIDDKPGNCEAFAANGGIAMLIPRPWNGHKDVVMYPLTEEEIEPDYNS